MEPSFNISSIFFNAAQKYPQHTALIDKEKRVTYLELSNEVQQMSHYFLSKGIQKGDRVLVFVPMSIDLYKTVLAIFNIGATVVFLDEWVNIKRLDVCCRLANCTAFIAPFKITLMGILLSKEIRKIPIKLKPNFKSITQKHTIENTNESDTALITFTTGSTGIPKAANRTHGFLHEQFKALDPLLNNGLDVDLPMLPIVLLLNLGKGKTSVIADFKASKPKSFCPQKILNQISTHQIKSITTSPYYLLQLAEYCIKHKERCSLQNIIVGGAAVFSSDAEILVSAFPSANITIVYGSTEAEPISHISAIELIKTQYNTKLLGLPVGRPDNSASVKIIEISPNPIPEIDSVGFRDMEKATNSVGEIIVSGNHVLTSYINNPIAIAQNKINVEGTIWHRTGDSGYIDEHNNLYLLGRCMQIIKHHNDIIYPFIVENQLKQYPGVITGTIILKNETPTIAIQINSLFREQDFEFFLKTILLNLFPYKILKTIPMDKRHHSKIDYDKLKTFLQD